MAGHQGGGYVLASVAMLKNICTREEFDLIIGSSRPIRTETGNGGVDEIYEKASSGGSSSNSQRGEGTATAEGILRLGELRTNSRNEQQLRLNNAATGPVTSAMVSIALKGKGKTCESEDYISNLGKSKEGVDLETYINKADRGSLAIWTDNTDRNVQPSQFPFTDGGGDQSSDRVVLRDLTSGLDGSTSDRAILIGRGYPSDEDIQDTPILAAMVGRNFAVSTGYGIRHIINSEYEVRDHGGAFYRVDLKSKKCSCKEYDMIGVPCTHAVSAGVNSGLKVETLVFTEYSNENWLLAYTGSVSPVVVPNVADVIAAGGMKLLPPSTRRPSGRPRRTRIPSAGEIRRAGVSKRKRVCSRCGGADHNRATCKEPI
ncbi:hypothetical protein Bca101_068639 [Brassica carinata]